MAARRHPRRIALFATCAATILWPAGAHAAFTPAVPVSPSMPSSQQLDVAVDDAGDMIAAWRGGEGLKPRVMYRVRHNGSWSAIAFASPAGAQGENPHGPLDEQGNALFVWRHQSEGSCRIEARPLSAAGALGAIQRVSMAGGDAAE